MAIVLPQRQAQPTFMGQLGAGVGEGFSSGIESLIDMKLQKMKKEQTVKSLSESFKGLVQQGVINETEAPMLANMVVEAPQAANMFLKDKMQRIRNREFANQQNVSQGLGALSGMQPQQDMLPQQGMQPDQGMQQQQGMQPMGAQPLQGQQPAIGQEPAYRYDPNLSPHENVQMDIAARNRQLKKEQMAQRHTIAGERLFQKRKSDALKETKPLREENRIGAKNAKRKLNIIRSGISYIDKGEMDHPLALEARRLLGVNFEALKKGDTKAFETLMNSLSVATLSEMSGVKSRHAMNLITSLSANSFQTPEQQRQILETQASLQALPIIRNDMQNQIMKEYEGKILPDNFAGLLDERMAPYEDNILNELANIAGVESPVGQDQQQGMPQQQVGAPPMEAPQKAKIPEYLKIPPAKPKALKKGKMGKEDKKQETWDEFYKRQLVRPAIKGAVAAAGFPGDVIDLSKSIVEYALKTATGKDIKLPKAAINVPLFTPFLNMAKYGLNKALGTKIDFPTGIPIPTSKGIRKVMTDVSSIFTTPEKLKKINKMMTPQNIVERTIDNVVESIAPMLLFPLAGAGAGISKGASVAQKVGRTALRGLKIAGISETAGALAETVGVGKAGVAGVKLGSVLLTAIAPKLSLKRLIKNGWNSTLDDVIYTDRLRRENVFNQKNLNMVRKALAKGIKPKKIKPYGISAEELKMTPQQAMLSEFDRANKIKEYLGDAINLKGKNKVFKALLAFTSPVRAAKIYATGKVLTGIGSVGATLSTLKKYPFLKQLYYDTIKAAARNNRVQVLKLASKLNEATKKIKD